MVIKISEALEFPLKESYFQVMLFLFCLLSLLSGLPPRFKIIADIANVLYIFLFPAYCMQVFRVYTGLEQTESISDKIKKLFKYLSRSIIVSVIWFSIIGIFIVAFLAWNKYLLDAAVALVAGLVLLYLLLFPVIYYCSQGLSVSFYSGNVSVKDAFNFKKMFEFDKKNFKILAILFFKIVLLALIPFGIAFILSVMKIKYSNVFVQVFTPYLCLVNIVGLAQIYMSDKTENEKIPQMQESI